MARPGQGAQSPLDRDLEAALRAFAERTVGARVGSIEPVEAGLGLRRFARVRFEGSEEGDTPAPVIARIDAAEDPRSRPAGIAPEPPLEPIRAALERAGLPVPKSFGRDEAHGIELLEDAGEHSLADLWPELSPDERRCWTERACALVPRIQRVAPSPIPAFERRLDARLFAYKAEQLVMHGLPFAFGRETRSAEADVVRRAFARIAAEAESAPARLAHRDFKAANLHPSPRAADELVMIDLQGAFLAPPEYDLVCLLRDLQVEIPDEWIDPLLREIRSELPDAPAPEVLERRFDWLTLSRVGKDLSRYALTWLERRDERYARHLPHAARMLERAARRSAPAGPEFGALADLLGDFSQARPFRDLAPLAERPCAR